MFGDEGGRPADHHFRSLHLQGVDVGDGYAGVGDVPDDDHFQAFDRTVAAAQGIGIQQGLRGVFVRAVAGVDDLGGYVFRQEYARSGIGWRMTTMSTFIDRMLLTVSIRVSPLVTEDTEAEKLTTSAERRFSASSKEVRVRVLFSKKRLAIVIPLSEGSFLEGAESTSGESFRRAEDQFQVVLFRYLIPNRWSTLRLSIGSMSYFSLVCVM